MKTIKINGSYMNDKSKNNSQENDSSGVNKEINVQLELPWYSSDNQTQEQNEEEVIDPRTNNPDLQGTLSGNKIEPRATCALNEVSLKNNQINNEPDKNINSELIRLIETDHKPIPDHFQGRGEVKPFYFSLVSKTNMGFCYEVSLDGRVIHYETFTRKINKRFGNLSYPGSNSFGIWAWIYRDRDKALAKLETL